MHATLQKFGYPDTVVHDYAHWAVLVRGQQPSLGSLILCCKEEVFDFGAISPAAALELQQATADIRALLDATIKPEKMNYLMLMMVDPHVHFHVSPRYAGERTLAGITIADQGWPKMPLLGDAVAASPRDVLMTLRDALRAAYPARATA